MKNTIWAIEQGTYSDYHVVGIFTSKERAQVVCDAINVGRHYDEAVIVEWSLDPAFDDLRAGRSLFAVRMLRDGNVEDVRQAEVSGGSIGATPYIWRRSQALAYREKNIEDCLCATVFADGVAHAVKIVNEKRLQMIAMNQWPVQEA